jgi:DNA-binding GntR family transcriptional regulator
MAFPKGQKMTPEQRARVSAGRRRAWSDNRPWLEASREIQVAANAGDTDRASELLHNYMRHHQALILNEKEPDDGDI